MKKKLIKVMLVFTCVFLIGGAFSCAPGASQADYDSLESQLSQAESQIDDLQDELASLRTVAPVTVTVTQPAGQIDDLNETIEDLNEQIATLDAEKTATEASFDELNSKYAELEDQYDALINPPEVTKEQIEQAVFDLMNMERTNNGVFGLEWGENIYKIAREHSQYMSELGKMEYAPWPYFQQLYIVGLYGTADEIADFAVRVWNLNEYDYENNLLSEHNKYGAVGVYIQGDIVFITFIAAANP